MKVDTTATQTEGQDFVLYEVRDHVAYITINRPERRNAIGRAVRNGLINRFAEASVDDDIWAVVLTGVGDKAFCAGGDLKETNERLQSNPKVRYWPMTGPDRNLYEVVLETYKPTLAVLNGPAHGGGCELALACDMRIAANHAEMCLPEAKRGQGANFGSNVLHRMIPRAIAMKMLYTGDPITAAEALHWGLVNEVVPFEDLANRAEILIRQIIRNAPVTLRRYKHVAVKGWDVPVASALRLDPGPNPYLSEDRKEGVKAFVEKREPQWSNR